MTLAKLKIMAANATSMALILELANKKTIILSADKQIRLMLHILIYLQLIKILIYFIRRTTGVREMNFVDSSHKKS